MCVTALVTKTLEAQGGCPTYADFAAVPEQNPFTRAAAQDAKNSSASAHGGTGPTPQGNISQWNTSQGNISQGNISQGNTNHYNFYFDTALSTNRVVLWAAVATAAAALGALMLVRTFKR